MTKLDDPRLTSPSDAQAVRGQRVDEAQASDLAIRRDPLPAECVPDPSAAAYTIEQLAPGAYDILLDGQPIAALVRDASRKGSDAEWQVDLLDEASSAERPAPFTAPSHAFGSRAAALAWLGISA